MWRDGTCSQKSDIWSLGCVLYELMTHLPPFDAPELAYKVLTITPSPLPPCYGAPLRQAVERMLLKDHGERPTAGELVKVPYLSQAIANWMHISSQPIARGFKPTIGGSFVQQALAAMASPWD